MKNHTFYTNILEFFSIILPGSIVAMGLYYLVKGFVDDLFLIGTEVQTFYLGFIFFLISYVFGHLIFQLGSYLDEILYDPFKSVLFKVDKNLALVKAIRNETFSKHKNELKKGEDITLDNFYGEGHIDNFSWSCYYLQENYPKAYEEVERLMADSKFFRGLMVIAFFFLVFSSIIKPYLTPIILTILFVAYKCSRKIVLSHDKNNFKNVQKISTKKNTDIEDKIRNIKLGKLIRFWKNSVIIIFIIIIVHFIIDIYIYNGFTETPTYSDIKQLITSFILPFLSCVLFIASLNFYFKIRKKSTKKAYRYVLYMEKLRIIKAK